MTHFSEIYCFGSCFCNREMTKIIFVNDWVGNDCDTPTMYNMRSFIEMKGDSFVTTEVNGIKDFIENYTELVEESDDEEFPLLAYPKSLYIVAVSE